MADKDQVIQALRATLISVKGALTIKQCNRDYRELQGEWIPFKKLGYPTLEKLFQDVPGFKMSQINGEWYVDAIASQETQHIASMVARQKSTKKTNVKLSSNRFPKKQGSWRKPASSSSYPSSYDKDYSKQFYRYKSNTSLYNNTKFQSNKYNKIIETKNPQPQQIKLPIKVAEQQEKVAPNVPKSYSAAPRDTHIDKLNHSKRNEKESEPRGRKVSASQRLTNLRDRLSTVDLIPLQLPAHNNYVEPLNAKENMDPVTQVVPAHNLEPPPESTSSQEKLEWTCRKLGLPQPVYNLYDYRPKKGPVTYDCTVKVGSTYSVSSYPDSSPSEQLARELAAGKVLAMVEGSEVQGLPTAGAARALQALADLVADHEAGLWASIVPHMYREKYNENLPNNWQELVENCPRILKDRVVNGLLVLLPNNKTQEPQEPQTPQSPLHCAPAGEEPIDSDLPPLQFPDQDFWNVFITVANSTLEVWLRIIGIEYSNMFDAMLIEMAKYYEHYGTSVDKSMIIKNAWYAVNLSDGGWQRAKLLDLEKDTATVFLGDHGDDDTVNITNVKILEPQFRKLPAQAILCRLEGAEELAASEAGAALVARRLPGEVLVAAPGPRADPTDPAVAVVLYDTSTQRDLNLNKEIVHDFCIAGAFTVTQKLTEMEVGCVTDEGRVWVSRAGGAALVRNALALLTSGPYRRPLPAAPHAPPPHPALFIVRTLAGDWVRCVIISELDGEGTVRTQLVDSGLVLRAPLSSLVPLHSFSPALNAYPYQAIQVRLGSAERVAASMATRLRELLVGASVLCRAAPAQHATHPNPCPDVELYVRSGPNHLLGSVNDSILIEYEYLKNAKTEDEGKSATDHVEALNKKKERIFRTASGGALGGAGAGAGAVRHVLPPPVLPAPGKCFDVYIAMAANPWNFIVQSNTNRYTLQTMMMELQRECPKLSPEDAPTGPAIGELFTAYYPKDSSWYRVTIAGTVTTTTVSIYFCDFGDLALFAMKDLRPVPASVPLARSLPPQAIKGKLFDVCPLYKDWTVEDCIRFQELCVEQQFVGICKEVDKDPLNPKEPLLILDLIDTSTDEDIYLNKQLVAEGRARLVSNS